MKKFLLSFCLFAVSFGLSAATYLHIKTTDGWQVIDLDKADRLTFKGGTMEVADASGKVIATYPQSTLENIKVDDESTGIDMIVAGKDCDATFRFDGATCSAEMIKDGLFEVFGIDGKKLVAIPAKAGDHIALDAMTGIGPVIVKSGSYTLKVAL